MACVSKAWHGPLLAGLLCILMPVAQAQPVDEPDAPPAAPPAVPPDTEVLAPTPPPASAPPVEESVIPADVPDEATLESSGAHIGMIEIQVDDVFNPQDPKESGFLYRLANRLHINTRDETVRTQLLFKPGDAYHRQVLDETARILRARKYLNDASIVPIRYHPDTNTVDLLVRVRDVWTLETGASFGQSGGEQSSGFDLSEGNLLGWGKHLSLGYSNDADRSSSEIEYQDQNLLGSRWVLETMYADTSDGNQHALLIEHPFFSFDTRWAAGVNLEHEERLDRVYDLGEIVDRYNTLHDSYAAYVGWSPGLKDGWTHRFSAGYQVDKVHYTPDPVEGTIDLPEDTHLAYPWLQWSWLQDRYHTEFNRDLIGRTEDVNYGRELTTRVGYSAPMFGADDRAWLFTVQWEEGYTLSPRQSLFATLESTARLDQGRWENTLISATLRYDYRRDQRSMFMAKLSSDYGMDLDEEQRLYLDADNGLRAYPLRYVGGDRRTVLTLEQRFYSDYQLLRLLTIGGLAFLDVGHVDGDRSTASETKRTLADIGIGLRFGNIRSSGGQVFHFDLAYPLVKVDGAANWQFNVRTMKAF